MKNTPHIQIENEIGFAKTVLMPGDPLRATYIAKNFLNNAVLVNNVRGISGYTGTWKDVKVSVMASGMGIPSMGIYSYELFNVFEVENILRIGTAGAIRRDLSLRDVIAGMGACTNSSYADQYNLPGTFAPIASYALLKLAEETAKEQNVDLKIGNIFSSDTFYDDTRNTLDWEKMGVLAVEMESAALYANAARLNKRALTLCTISDLLFDLEQQLTPKERQTSVDQMIRIALDVAVKAERLS